MKKKELEKLSSKLRALKNKIYNCKDHEEQLYYIDQLLNWYSVWDHAIDTHYPKMIKDQEIVKFVTMLKHNLDYLKLFEETA